MKAHWLNQTQQKEFFIGIIYLLFIVYRLFIGGVLFLSHVR